MDPPEEPDPDECCNSGCNPCILDVYQDQLKKYNDSLVDRRHCDNVKPCLQPTRLSVFRVVEIRPDSEVFSVYVLEFARFFKDHCDGDYGVKFEPGQYVFVKITDKCTGEEYSRAFTPLWATGLQFAVLVKHYKEGSTAQFLRDLKIGDETLWRGPYGDFQLGYMQKNILCVAQGSCIAPFYSIFETLLLNKDCCTFLKLFLCCKKNIPLRDKLQEWSTYWNFTYEIFLSEPCGIEKKYNETIHGERLNCIYLKNYVEKATMEGLQILVCGNVSFSEDIKRILTDNINCDPKCIWTF